ncbi:cytochrome C biosynthesis protein, partial [Rhodopseudomonas palustris]|nr:cytochrome C biosynthesis protein [Rhodopseudomonas palustris]
MKKNNLIAILLIFTFFSACKSGPGESVTKVDKQPQIEPGYTGLTIPVNIAPLNFIINEKGDSYAVTISSATGESVDILSREGEIIIPEKKWKSLLKSAAGQEITYKTFVKNAGKWIEFESFSNSVSKAPIPLYVLYRLLYPGYESWKEMSIMQR